MISSEIVCQECGKVDEYDNMQKVSGEGWVCFTCIQEWLKGDGN